MTSFQAGVLTSVSLVIEFIVGSKKKVGFLAKIEHMYAKEFILFCDWTSSKYAKIRLSVQFLEKKESTEYFIDFHLRF